MKDVAYIEVTRGAIALIDKDMEEYVRQRVWTYNGRYVLSADWKNKPANIMLHRYILQPPFHLYVDHVNGDGLDNRRCNLRLATNRQNQANTGPNANNTTGYKGVSFDKRVGKFKSNLRTEGKRIFLGYFVDAAEAAQVYDAAALKYHGEYAYQNFKEGHQKTT